MRKTCSLLWIIVAIIALFSSHDCFASQEAPEEKLCGPTIKLDYGKNRLESNPVSTFVYFVPIIAPTPVENWMSKNNSQVARLTSYKRKNRFRSFTVKCCFEMSGKGSFKNVFKPKEMIEHKMDSEKKGVIKHLIDYIKFEGDAHGCIVIKGKTRKKKDIVKEITISFKDKSQKSPVLIKMYDAKKVNGKYNSKNRKNEYIARVNKLIFKNCDSKPKMSAKIASIRSSKKKEGLLAKVGGMVVNVLMPPMDVSKTGNDAMIRFGEALIQKKPAYVFPVAKKLDIQIAMSQPVGVVDTTKQ